jgi:hypothetical protein
MVRPWSSAADFTEEFFICFDKIRTPTLNPATTTHDAATSHVVPMETSTDSTDRLSQAIDTVLDGSSRII